MTDESKLAPRDTFSLTASSLATTAMANAAATTGWQRKLMNVFIGIVTVVSLIGLVSTIASWGSIPARDAQQTRDTLSDLNKANKFNATKYNFIKQVARTARPNALPIWRYRPATRSSTIIASSRTTGPSRSRSRM
jgi:hypothetical protein